MSNTSTTPLAPLSLDVIIAGAGFSGLAAAYTLSKSGHRVRVLDQHPTFGSIKNGGLKIPPNLTKIFNEWGLGEKLKAITTPAKGTEFISLETGESIGYQSWQEEILETAGGQFLLAPFDDVLRLIYDLALESGAEVHFDQAVVAYEYEQAVDGIERPVLRLADGTRLRADLVIGAGGLGSLARATVDDEEEDGKWGPTGMGVLCGVIPGNKMREDPSLSGLLELSEWTIWMGSGRSIVGHPSRNGEEYIIQMFWPNSDVEPWPSDSPYSWIKCSANAPSIDTYEPRINRMLKLVPSFVRTRFISRATPLSEWTDRTGSMVLIGDAAHPIFPCGMLAVAVAIEDAVVLGWLLSRIKSLSTLPRLLSALQEIQETRRIAAAESEDRTTSFVWLPPGPERDARNEGLRATRARKDASHEEALLEQWEEIGAIFGYSPTEAAEDWWAKWGRMIGSSDGGGELGNGIDVVQEMEMRLEGHGRVVQV